ncbi:MULTISPECIES: sensor histidine kinase [Calothrix]|uniref:histidine kinase n=2 Tax=Calothrix TaxID=1186 RepID=A0ABR8A997_9CYAN|nr:MULTISPECIES: HAMP domain-containing sensor histidine kinase [Calothrix]MBD2195863.1 HAMP domain-containing histidine kinase [Calothrix parietina FACHB-288]MBD2226388.1 HAMP domain-containing histidine kinase [Calothrix anomala FACHB-343]
MKTGFSPQHTEQDFDDLNSFNIQSFCQLQSEQLISHYPIIFARIVYYDSLGKTHQEVISYAPNQPPFSAKELAYLRSERWLNNYPAVFEVQPSNLHDIATFAYICPIGYRNQKPEYIQIITKEALALDKQQQLQQSAMLLSKYASIYLIYGRQKTEIQLLEELIHKIGHQLRNSLAMIGLYAHNLYLGLSGNKCQEQATIIREGIEDLETNLSQLIDCGQGAKLRKSPQDLRTLVLESIKGLEPLIQQKQININIPTTSTNLLIDRLQMKQVFDNLLSNAVYFSPHGATVTCSWQIFQEEILIKISDRGTGLSPEDIQKIFTPFYSRRPGGTGLGLTIARKIILDHRGNLWAQSVAEGGAQFCVVLPRLKMSRSLEDG